MNKTMIMNVITPLIGVAATWLAAKVPLLDQATWNYDDAEYTWDDMDCGCGARGCRGELTEKDWMLSELQARYQGHFHPIVQKMIDALDRVTPIR